MVAIDQQKIIDFIKLRGPILPVQLAKFMGTDIIIASAHLSELVSSKKAMISNVKVGGSPLYYVEGQETKLQNYVEQLNEKDRKAFALLKEKKVLRDNTLTPLMRVAVRTIKDFAIPLQVSSDVGTEIFWKWYLLSDDAAKLEIKRILEIQEKQQTLQQVSSPQAAPEPITIQAPEIQKTVTEVPKPIEKGIEEVKKEIKTVPEIRGSGALDAAKTRKPEAAVGKKPEVKIEEKRKTEKEPIKESKKEKPIEKQAKIEEKVNLAEKQKKKEEQKAQAVEGVEEKANIEKKTKRAADDLFLNKVIEYFASKGVIIAEQNIVKKNSEIDMIVKIPSAVGMIEHFCKAKNKKRISEGDLSNTFVQGQIRKMPAILLAVGELVKKAKEQLEKDFKGIMFLKL